MQFFETSLNTDKANCIGEDPNIFFDIEEDGWTPKYIRVFEATVRPICASCPIWADCLKWAVDNKEVGVWGGLTTVERSSIKDRRMVNVRNNAFRSLARFGITEQQIREAIGLAK